MATDVLQSCDVVECLPRSETAQGTRQECVLLIEDSEEAMLLVRYALQEYGNGTYRLEWADGLTAALHRLSKGGIDLVLLDLGLPETAGPASYAAIRKAAPELPILVLTGDDREQTESAISISGAEDFLLKDEVSGALLLQAIRSALYSNRRWRNQKTANYKQSQKFHWADEKCQALLELGQRLIHLHRIEPTVACGKAICAIVKDYAQGQDATPEGSADLMLPLERLARLACAHGHKDGARQLRALIVAPSGQDQTARRLFDTAIRQRISQLAEDRMPGHGQSKEDDQPDLAMALRKILEAIPKTS